MSRRLTILAILASSEIASADPDTSVASTAQDELGDQGVGAMTGVAIGGRTTSGGVRFTGHYLYQLDDNDWFDGIASFTFGSSAADCYRDRMDTFQCAHGPADGSALEIAAGVRRVFAAQGAFRPFARAAIGLSYTRFPDDDVSGVSIPLHAGGGVRARVASGVALVGLAELTLGLGRFGRDLATEPQIGLAVTAGAEFRLP